MCSHCISSIQAVDTCHCTSNSEPVGFDMRESSEGLGGDSDSAAS
jgi:hypothetical protein